MNESGPSFFNNGGTNQYEAPEARREVSVGTLNLAKIFGWMSAGLLVTGVCSVLFALLFEWIFESNPNAMIWVWVGTSIASIGTFICTIFAGCLSFTSQRKPTSHSVAVPFFIYAVLIGYLFGLIVLACPWEPLAITFGCTSLLFGVLALIGGLSKRNMSLMGFIGSALIGGAMMIMLVNFMLMWLAPQVYDTIYWIVSFAIFAGLMFSTIWDVWQIKTISQHYENTPNLNLFCAFRLYCDFIALFIRLLYFVLIFYSRNRD